MNSDFSISIDDQAIATITWDCEKKSMNVLSFEALETLEKLIDLSKLFSSSVISTVSFKSLLETSYSEGISKLKIAFLPISVEANEDKCVFNESHSKRLIAVSYTHLTLPTKA